MCLLRKHKMCILKKKLHPHASTDIHTWPHMCETNVYFLSRMHSRSSAFCGSFTVANLPDRLNWTFTIHNPLSWDLIQDEVEVNIKNTQSQQIMIKLRSSSSVFCSTPTRGFPSIVSHEAQRSQYISFKIHGNFLGLQGQLQAGDRMKMEQRNH